MDSEPTVSKWHDARTDPPDREDAYLVLSKDAYDTRYYSKKLSDFDRYVFDGEDGPGWVYHDAEYGFSEDPNVIMWAEIPREEL